MLFVVWSNVKCSLVIIFKSTEVAEGTINNNEFVLIMRANYHL